MVKQIYDTVIVGAGISGLACARKLHEYNKNFLLISDDIGGRILVSEDGSVNYGAFFVCEDYHHLLKFVTLKKQIRLRDFCFHEKDKTYVLFEPIFIKYLFQFLKTLKILYKFRRLLRKLRIDTETISQKKAIESEPFLHSLYMQNAVDLVKKYNIMNGTEKYLSKGLYSTTFSPINKMNAFSFLQFILPFITPIYRFTFQKEKMIEPFKEKIMINHVIDITYKNNRYKVKFNDKTIKSKKIVLATQINWSKKFAGVEKTNSPVDTNMLHIKGKPKKIISKKEYQLFGPPSNVQAIANLNDGTFLFYYKNKQPSLYQFFNNHKILFHKHWDPAGTINGQALIESNRGNNMYLIGDYNIAGLEESYITGVFAANQLLKSK